MSRVDRFKEELSGLRLFFTVFFAVDASIMAWLAQNYRKAENLLIIGTAVTSAVFTIFLMWLVWRMYRLYSRLEKF